MKINEGDWSVDAQYRWYQDFNAVHHAQIDFKATENDVFTVGITQVPFGLAPYSSHSFWFSGAYYLGLEDDYDTGVKWSRTQGDWLIDAAWFAGSEYDDASRYGRYSFDVAHTSRYPLKESGQFNMRVRRDLGGAVVGGSYQWGQLDGEQGRDADHQAVALHAKADVEQWNIQAQWIYYRYDINGVPEADKHRLALSAFEYPFEIAAKAQVVTFNVARTFAVNNRFLKSVTCYNDYSYIAAGAGSGLADSVQNVTGCMLQKGGMYSYIDWISGKNMWFAGGPGVGIEVGEPQWQSRLNINIGYYF